MQKRQQDRLNALEKGEAVAIPQYFHTTYDSAAISIAKTGIEAVQATSGFGAFLSTDPEFRYGYVAFGLPKTVEFSSEAHTILDTNSAPGHILTRTDEFGQIKRVNKCQSSCCHIRAKFLIGHSSSCFHGLEGNRRIV